MCEDGLVSANSPPQIIPTGYFVARNAFNILQPEERQDVTALVIGCGPVGLCAITAAKTFFKVGQMS